MGRIIELDNPHYLLDLLDRAEITMIEEDFDIIHV